MQFLTFADCSKYCKSYFPTMHIICGYGFACIKLEVAVLSFSLNSCSENFRKFTRKVPVVESFF